MQLKSVVVAPALKALLESFIDYAGVFPPARVSVDEAVTNYEDYRSGEYSWMLHWLVIDNERMDLVPKSLDGSLAVITQSDDTRAAALETKSVVRAQRPVYCEVALSSLQELDNVKQAGCFAKIRTGGLKPEAIPSSSDVAAFILACADRRLAFKATAGLHHPIRKEHQLTYEADAPRAIMHGFLNVLMASTFAWHGERQIEPIISEMDATAFSFDERAHWHTHSLSVAEIQEARQNFMHSVGSCSFNEPVNDLKELGLL
jgi:hypothetical protein